VTVEVSEWGEAFSVLHAWDAESREANGITGRVVVVAVDQGEVLPLGLAFFGGIGTGLPLLEDGVEALAEQLGMPLRGRAVRSRVQAAGDRLVACSYERVRRAHRMRAWWVVPPSATQPSETSATLREQFGAEIDALNSGSGLTDGDRYKAESAAMMLELCEAVDSETGQPDGFAAQLASIDVTALATATPGQLANRFFEALTIAIDADATRE
jgi:hypothetical protein